MSGATDLSCVTAGLPAIRKIQENCYKLHACCGHTHSAIDLAIALRARAGLSESDAGERVSAIDVETYGPGFDIVKESRPRTPYQAKFSMAYCVAVAIVEGRAGLEQFAADRFGSDGVTVPPLASLLERTRVRVAEDLTARYPAAWPARVTLTLTDGSLGAVASAKAARVCDASDYPRGNPENPIDRRELEEKFTALVAPRFGADAATRALAVAERLRRSQDVARDFVVGR
jgi:2-methylcitrate dehydratase PrpD